MKKTIIISTIVLVILIITSTIIIRSEVNELKYNYANLLLAQNENSKIIIADCIWMLAAEITSYQTEMIISLKDTLSNSDYQIKYKNQLLKIRSTLQQYNRDQLNLDKRNLEKALGE